MTSWASAPITSRRPRPPFTAEVHVCYLQELSQGEHFTVSWQLLGFDSKRLHFFEHLHCGERLIATSEQMALHVSMETRRTAPFPEEAVARLDYVAKAHAALPRPAQQGRILGNSQALKATGIGAIGIL